MGSARDRRVLCAIASTILALAGVAHAQGVQGSEDGPRAQDAPPAEDAPPDLEPPSDAPPPPGAHPPGAQPAQPAQVAPSPHEIAPVATLPEPRDRPPNAAAAPGAPEIACCATSHVRRWFVHVLGGVAGQESTGLVGGSIHVDIGTHPFLGAFGTGLSGGAELLGLPLIAAHFGIFAQLDLAYAAARLFWPDSLSRELPVSLAFGGRLGLAYGRSQRDVEWVPDAFVFELWRPEWRLYLDLEIPVATLPGDVRMRLVGRLAAIDLSIDFSELSRWTVQVGVAFEWVRDPLLAGGAVE